MKKINEEGFAVLEAVLLVVIIGLVGFVGWFVWHSSQQTKATLDAASKSSQSSPPLTASNRSAGNTSKPAQTYFTIQEWGVRAPYDGNDSFTYTLNTDSPKIAEVVSAKLKAADAGCSHYGAGEIVRYAPGDDVSFDQDGSMTAKQAAAGNPLYVHVGDYYYLFRHDQAACGDDTTVESQNEANATVKSLVDHLETVPAR